MATFPSVNRRRLLTSAAAITVASIAPDIARPENRASSAPPPTQPPVPPSTDAQVRNFDPITILRLREIAERNSIRHEAGLPLLSLAKELRHMKEAADTQEFKKFSDAHRNRLYEKMLARVRRRCGDPNWAPTGMLSGGGLSFGAQVDKELRNLYWRITRTGAPI